MRLTHDQMMALWRRARGLESVRTDCSIELYEGVNLTAALATEMRLWYLNLLDTAPLCHLTLTDVARRLKVSGGGRRGVWRVDLPPDVRRMVSVTLDNGATAIVLQTDDAPTRVELMSANPFALPGADAPVARRCADGSLLILADTAAAPVIKSAMAVSDPGDEFYELNESALSLIPGSV